MTRLEEYRKCAEQGMTKAETARHLGVSKSAVTRASQKHKIPFAHRPMSPEHRAKISARLREMWRDGTFRRSKLCPAHIKAMTPEQRLDYETLRSHGYKMHERLQLIGIATNETQEGA